MPDVDMPNAAPCPAVLRRVAVARARRVERRGEAGGENVIARLAARRSPVVPPLARRISEELGQDFARRRDDATNGARRSIRLDELVPGSIDELRVREVEQ